MVFVHKKIGVIGMVFKKIRVFFLSIYFQSVKYKIDRKDDDVPGSYW